MCVEVRDGPRVPTSCERGVNVTSRHCSARSPTSRKRSASSAARWPTAHGRCAQLEERIAEAEGRAAFLSERNDKLAGTLRDAREQLVSLKEEVDRLGQPPSGYGIFLNRHEDGTVDVFTGGRKLRVIALARTSRARTCAPARRSCSTRR